MSLPRFRGRVSDLRDWFKTDSAERENAQASHHGVGRAVPAITLRMSQLIAPISTNRGGPGRPREEVRQALLRSYDERIPALEAIVDGEAVDYVPTRSGLVAVPPKLNTVVRAMAELRARAGLGFVPEKPDKTRQVHTWRFEPAS